MLILLPPSEGKADPPADSPPLDLGQLAFPEALGEARERLLDQLAALAALDRDRAIGMLGISPGQAGDVDRNARLSSAPAAPASEVYTGVLYDRLDLPGLPARARKRADSHLFVASGLWGLIRPGDRIPKYRFPAKAKLPEVGGLAAFWRPHLAGALDRSGFDRRGGTVLDMRSAAYASFWKPTEATLVPVRPFTEVAGARKAVSHMAKAIRGEVARIVLSAPKMPEEPEDVADLLRSEGLEVELSGDGLDVIETA